METDGIGCSFVCWKPEGQAGKESTPQDVPMAKGRTVFRVVDPRVRDIGTVGTFECGDAMAPGSEMPEFSDDDRDSMFRISAAEWHDKAYHNTARRRREKLICEAKKRGLDVCALESAIPSGKTISADKFLEHIKVAVEHFPRLYEHYKQERQIRWKTYRKEQKAMDDLCMQVKGDPLLEKEDVVVAYGAGQFGSTMRGLRSVPVKRFREHLSRYVTVVLTDERWTSQK
jgi:hypothetical protein